MNEDALRALVRDAISRHLGRTDRGPAVAPEPRVASHGSHARFALTAGSDGDGACLIEPAVRCNHCGYCKSYGH